MADASVRAFLSSSSSTSSAARPSRLGGDGRALLRQLHAEIGPHVAPAQIGQLVLRLMGERGGLGGADDGRARPASREFVGSLPLVNAADGSECTVCMDAFAPGTPAMRLPCRHLFHDECVRPWLSVHNTCPACRLELPTDDPEYERERTRRRLNALPEVQRDSEPAYDPMYG